MIKTVCTGICFLMFFIAVSLAQTGSEHAVAVTILSADLTGLKVVAKTVDGKEQTFRFTSKTPVGQLAEAATSRKLAGGQGYQFIIRYSVETGEKVATAFDYVGKGPWKTFSGTLMKVDPTKRTIIVRTPEGIEGTFYAAEYCMVEDYKGAKRFIDWANVEVPQETRVKARYTVVGVRKTVHLIEYDEEM